MSKEEKENGGWVGIKNKSLKPQDVASLASAGAFTATKRRFKKSKDGFFNKKIKGLKPQDVASLASEASVFQRGRHFPD